MNLYKELQEKLGEHDPTDVDELILDDLFSNVEELSTDNKKDFEKYCNLVHLSLNGFGLKTLTNFPSLPTLQVLEIRNNQLEGKDLKKIAELYPELYKLKLGDNRNITLDSIISLSKSKIKKLEVDGTRVAEGKDYRSNIFEILEELDIVDNQTKDGDEVSSTIYEDDEDGEFGEDEDGELDDEDDDEDDGGDFDDEVDDDDENDDDEVDNYEGDDNNQGR